MGRADLLLSGCAIRFQDTCKGRKPSSLSSGDRSPHIQEDAWPKTQPSFRTHVWHRRELRTGPPARSGLPGLEAEAAAVPCAAGHVRMCPTQPCPVRPAKNRDRAPCRASASVLAILHRRPNYSCIVTYLIYGDSFFPFPILFSTTLIYWSKRTSVELLSMK